MRIDWSTIPVVPGMRAGSERQGICADKLSAVRVVTGPDAVFDGRTHWHDNEQLLVMVSGLVRLVVDGREFEAHPGDLVFFPAGSWHAAVGVGPEGAVYYEIFAPARPDQLRAPVRLTLDTGPSDPTKHASADAGQAGQGKHRR